MVSDTRLLGNRPDQWRDGRDRQDRDRDQRQRQAELDEAQAVATVEDRITRDFVLVGIGLQDDLAGGRARQAGACLRSKPRAREDGTYPFVIDGWDARSQPRFNLG